MLTNQLVIQQVYIIRTIYYNRRRYSSSSKNFKQILLSSFLTQFQNQDVNLCFKHKQSKIYMKFKNGTPL